MDTKWWACRGAGAAGGDDVDFERLQAWSVVQEFGEEGDVLREHHAELDVLELLACTRLEGGCLEAPNTSGILQGYRSEFVETGKTVGQ